MPKLTKSIKLQVAKTPVPVEPPKPAKKLPTPPILPAATRGYSNSWDLTKVETDDLIAELIRRGYYTFEKAKKK